MIQYKNYIFFEGAVDFLSNVKEDKNPTRFYINGGYINYRPDSFPVTFCYCESMEPHFCGDWYPVETMELIKLLTKDSRILTDTAHDIIAMIDKEG